jgi:hypothetical protein
VLLPTIEYVTLDINITTFFLLSVFHHTQILSANVGSLMFPSSEIALSSSLWMSLSCCLVDVDARALYLAATTHYISLVLDIIYLTTWAYGIHA